MHSQPKQVPGFKLVSSFGEGCSQVEEPPPPSFAEKKKNPHLVISDFIDKQGLSRQLISETGVKASRTSQSMGGLVTFLPLCARQ